MYWKYYQSPVWFVLCSLVTFIWWIGKNTKAIVSLSSSRNWAQKVHLLMYFRRFMWLILWAQYSSRLTYYMFLFFSHWKSIFSFYHVLEIPPCFACDCLMTGCSVWSLKKHYISKQTYVFYYWDERILVYSWK